MPNDPQTARTIYAEVAEKLRRDAKLCRFVGKGDAATKMEVVADFLSDEYPMFERDLKSSKEAMSKEFDQLIGQL